MYEDLMAANRQYVAGFALGRIPARAAKGFGLLTCMDSRIEPLVMLGLGPGDAKILRNAGGRVTPDVLRSFVLATSFLGVERLAVMHHTGCALAGTNDDEIRAGMEPSQATAAADWGFLSMPDPSAALAVDVEAIRACTALPQGITVEGWLYDVHTGLIDRVIKGNARKEAEYG